MISLYRIYEEKSNSTDFKKIPKFHSIDDFLNKEFNQSEQNEHLNKIAKILKKERKLLCLESASSSEDIKAVEKCVEKDIEGKK